MHTWNFTRIRPGKSWNAIFKIVYEPCNLNSIWPFCSTCTPNFLTPFGTKNKQKSAARKHGNFPKLKKTRIFSYSKIKCSKNSFSMGSKLEERTSIRPHYFSSFQGWTSFKYLFGEYYSISQRYIPQLTTSTKLSTNVH